MNRLLESLWLRSIPAKVVALVGLIIGSISAFFFLLMPMQLETEAREALVQKAESIGEMAAYNVRSALVFDDRDGMMDALAGAARNSDVLYVAVANLDNVVLAQHHAVDARPGPADDRLADGTDAVHRLRVPVQWEGETIGFLSLGMRSDRLERVVRARQTTALLSLLVFSMGMLAALIGSRLVTRPLIDMVGTAQRISEGDLSERADIRSRDEVGRLAEVFNVMVGRLQAAHEELEETNRTLEARVETRTRQLLDSEQLLRQAQKMEAVGRLAAGVAHDFNNLLTVINGHTELALLSLAEDDPVRESVEAIGASGVSAASLTQQLLAFSRKQVLQPVDLDVNDVIGEVVKILERLLGENVGLTLDLEPNVGVVRADPGQLQQVIMNLAVNAKDAMPNGGELVISTRNCSIAPSPDLHGDGGPFGDSVELKVSDTGHGMSRDVQTMAFEPFFSTKSASKGTGLGLSTVYGIVSQSGGHLRLESRVGEGTSFSLYFPRIEKQASRSDGAQASLAYEHGTERILLVEDSYDVRHLASRMLERAGYRITEADCGEVALERLSENDGDFDLLLTDVVMPRMSGRELAETVCATYPHMAMMYMSGYTDDEVVLSGIRDNDVTFLEKPFTRDRLLLAVRTALDGPGLAA